MSAYHTIGGRNKGEKPRVQDMNVVAEKVDIT